MRISIALTAIAPLALLAACGDSAPDEQAPMTTEIVADASATADTDLPPPASSLEGVDFAGDYSLTDESGQTSRISLRADDTYDYTGPDGTTRSGSYQRMDDGRRIMIEDFDGRAGYFSIGEGTIYRLPDADTPYNQITVTDTYRRENAPVPTGGPGATTNSVNDKRGGV
jgi:hypothetical protein